MVRLILLLIITPVLLSAQSFSSQINRTILSQDQSISLSFNLQNVTNYQQPDFSKLDQDFTILSRQNSTQTSIINGDLSQNIVWQLILKAKRTGNLRVPAISVKTDRGELQSKPIIIKVSKAKPLAAHDQDKDVQIIVQTENKSPFVNQPVFLTVSVLAKARLYNVYLEAPNFSDAVIEEVGKPENFSQIVKGHNYNIYQQKYLITPLVSGSLKIPAFRTDGKVAYKGHSLFNNQDLFAEQFFGSLEHFGRFRTLEFKLASKLLELDVQPAKKEVSPWLPAKSLIIAETSEIPNNIMVGEAITRKFIIEAEGLKAKQLPEIKNFLQSQNLKIYVDEPKLNDQINKSGLLSSKKETFTLIPQTSGKISMPEIRIPWWNTLKNRIEYARIPELTIEVRPDPAAQAPATIINKNQTPGDNPVASPKNSLLLKLSVAALLLLVILLSLLSIRLNTKLKQKRIRVKSPDQPRINLKSIEKCSSTKELYEFIINYAELELGLPANQSLKEIFDDLIRDFGYSDADRLEQLRKNIEGELFANQKTDLNLCMHEAWQVLKDLKPIDTDLNTQSTFNELNP